VRLDGARKASIDDRMARLFGAGQPPERDWPRISERLAPAVKA